MVTAELQPHSLAIRHGCSSGTTADFATVCFMVGVHGSQPPLNSGKKLLEYIHCILGTT